MLGLQVIFVSGVASVVLSILGIFIFDNDNENILIDVKIKNSILVPVSASVVPEKSEADKFKAVAQMRLQASGMLHGKGDDFYQSDRYLLRWLKENDFNVVLATRMALEAREWRLKNRIDDSILNETLISFPVHPFYFGGFDKEGHPLVFLTIKLLDVRKMILTTKREDVVRGWIQILELGENYLKNAKHTNLINETSIEGITGIIDAAGGNLKQHMCLQCISAHVEAVLIFDKYYPGILHRIIVVNVNRVGLNFVKFITPFISASMLNSVKLFGTNQTEWKEYLLSIISSDELPRHFGGIKVT